MRPTFCNPVGGAGDKYEVCLLLLLLLVSPHVTPCWGRVKRGQDDQFDSFGPGVNLIICSFVTTGIRKRIRKDPTVNDDEGHPPLPLVPVTGCGGRVLSPIYTAVSVTALPLQLAF